MQRYRVIIMLVLFGVLPVAGAFFFALSFLDEQEVVEPEPVAEPVVEAPPPPPETRQVLAAARALPVGTLIGPGDLVEATLNRADVHAEHVLPGRTEPDELNGWAMREALVAGAPLTWPAVVGPGQAGFLAAVLSPGTRAVTVRVGTSTRQAALIDPGDRVDVILSANLDTEARDGVTLVRTIVEDVRVVAIDRRIVDEQPGTPEDDDPVERAEIETATLEVSPAQGDRLVLGEQEGSLSLAVRSLATATGPAQGEAAARIPGVALGLEELLLSETGEDRASALEERLRAEIAASEARLWAAIEGGAAPHTVRIIRGSESVEQTFGGWSPMAELPEDDLAAVLPRPGTPSPSATPPRAAATPESGTSPPSAVPPQSE